jgi:hypothetical protein
MALMASKSNAFVDQNSHLELKTCVEYLWLPTFIVWLLNIAFLLLHYHVSRYRSNKKSQKNLSIDIDTIEEADEEEQPSVFVMTNRTKVPRFTERFRLRRLKKTGEQTSSIPLGTSTLMVDRSVSVASFPSLDLQTDDNTDTFQPSESRFFKIILFLLLITVIVLLFISSNKIYFDIGM